MSLKTLTVFLFCCLYLHVAFAQKGEEIEVHFEGLKRTKASFLHGFLNPDPEILPTDEVLKGEVQKLKNIAGIGNAYYRIDSLDNVLRIVYIVEEVQTWLPIVNFGGIKGNVWFQLGYADINWRGKGQNLSFNYQNTDRRHGGQVYFRAPYFRSSPWGYSLSLSKLSSREPLYFNEGEVSYDYDNNSSSFSLIRNFGIHRSLEGGGTYFVEKYKKSKNQILENPPGPDNFKQPKWLSKWEYRENFLDYNYFYLKGLSWQLTLQNVYNTIDENWFHSLQFQGRQFFRWKKNGNLALRLRLAISTNNDSPFAPFVVDSHVNLRGSGNRIDRGTAQIILNVEHRQTIYHSRFWAAQVVGFTDIGAWRNPGGKLEDLINPDLTRQYIGGGFRLIYQKVYSAILRVDYGVDVFNTESRGLVIGLGQYF